MTNFFMAEPSSAPGPERACCVLSDGSEAPKDWKYMHPQDAWLGVLQGFYRGPQGPEESCSHLPASSFIACNAGEICISSTKLFTSFCDMLPYSHYDG